MTNIEFDGLTVNLTKMTNARTAAEIRDSFDASESQVAWAVALAQLPRSIRTINIIEANVNSA